MLGACWGQGWGEVLSVQTPQPPRPCASSSRCPYWSSSGFTLPWFLWCPGCTPHLLHCPLVPNPRPAPTAASRSKCCPDPSSPGHQRPGQPPGGPLSVRRAPPMQSAGQASALRVPPGVSGGPHVHPLRTLSVCQPRLLGSRMRSQLSKVLCKLSAAPHTERGGRAHCSASAFQQYQRAQPTLPRGTSWPPQRWRAASPRPLFLGSPSVHRDHGPVGAGAWASEGGLHVGVGGQRGEGGA